MSLVSSRGIIRASKNPDCHLLAAAAIEAPDEKRFYEEIMGEPFRGEYGERASARRRGAQFEANNHAADAAQLKEALAPLFALDPKSMWVRNMVDEFPGPINQIHAVRLHRMRDILAGLRIGRSVPDIIIQPTLALRLIQGTARGSYYISPDFLVFDRSVRSYRIGEMKSFIVRDRASVDPKDLDNTRRQSAVGILALADELNALGLPMPSDPLGLFIFATPYGLKPAPPHQELLRAEIEQVRRGIESMRFATAKLVELRRETPTMLANLVDEFQTNYRESCVGSCLLAKRCQELDRMNPARHGDAAARTLGSVRLDRLVGVLRARPEELTPEESELQRKFRSSANVLGLSYDTFLGMIA
jgi:hypothetical protein